MERTFDPEVNMLGFLMDQIDSLRAERDRRVAAFIARPDVDEQRRKLTLIARGSDQNKAERAVKLLALVAPRRAA